jgi:hypothetical protein
VPNCSNGGQAFAMVKCSEGEKGEKGVKGVGRLGKEVGIVDVAHGYWPVGRPARPRLIWRFSPAPGAEDE